MEYWRWIRGVLLTTLGGLGAGILICRLLGYPARWAIIFPAVGLLGGIIGVLSIDHGAKTAGLLFGLGLCIASTAAIFLFRAYLAPVLTVAVYLLSFGAVTACGFAFYGPLGVWTTILSGLSIFAGRSFGPGWEHLSGTAAILALVLTADGFRDISIRKAYHKKREHRTFGDPGGITKQHFLLAGTFLMAALSLGLITLRLTSGLLQALKATAQGSFLGFLGIFNWLFRAIEAILQWFSDLFPDLTSQGGSYGPEGSTPEIYTGGPGSMLSTIIMIIIFVLCCLAVSILAGRFFIRSRTRGKESPEVADYEDEVEALEHPKLRIPLFRRKTTQKYRHISDPKVKIRYIFQQMLRCKMKEDALAITKTPNELLDPTTDDEASLVDIYNRVKYALDDVTEEELTIAERYLSRIKK